jgi:hypothetical protein
MRNAMRLFSSSPLLMESAFAILSVPLFRAVAEHVFFARGSFPDVSRKAAANAGALLKT